MHGKEITKYEKLKLLGDNQFLEIQNLQGLLFSQLIPIENATKFG